MQTQKMKKIKTILGDEIYFDRLKLPLRGCANLDPTQLWRCKKHKKVEAKCVLHLPHGSSFLDCGSHFGDTVLTMAIHARANGRDDLRFIAFEPSRRKCKFIRSIVKANGLTNVKIVNACIGDTCRRVTQIREEGFVRYDGRVAYRESDLETDKEESRIRHSREGTGIALYYNGIQNEYEYESPSESESSDDEKDESSSMISLDSMMEEILPLGFLHLDVEGWEVEALRGADKILKETNNVCYVVCEVWDIKDKKRRHLAVRDTLTEDGDGEPGHGVLTSMAAYPQFERLPDIVDQDRNMFFKVKQIEESDK